MTPHTLPSTAPRTLHIANLAGDDYQHGGQDRPVTDDLDAANVVSSISSDSDSELGPVFHYPVLDIDIPAALVPSSTPGHFHLYLDHGMPDADYWELCDALAKAGILQPGYVSACKSRGYTSVRLPWVKKAAAETSPEEADAAAIVAQAVAQAEADHNIAEAAREWVAAEREYYDADEDHKRAAMFSRAQRRRNALTRLVEAEEETRP